MKYGIIITFATLLVLGACRRSTPGNEVKTEQQSTAKTEQRKQNIIKKRISIPFDFSYITNLGSVDIIYTQGNYSIEVGSFESQATWRAENIQLGVLSTGSMKIGRVECTTFELQSTDIGDITLTDLQADDATLYSRSSATINANVNVKNLFVINEGTQKMKLTGKAQNVRIKNPDDINLVNELD